MNFVDRVKHILLTRNEDEIKKIDLKIEELRAEHEREAESVKRLREESTVATKEKSSAQKNVLSKKELKELEHIYNFVANYSQIVEVIDAVRHISGMIDSVSGVEYFPTDEELLSDEEFLHRARLCSVVNRINQEIERILNGENNQVENDNQEKKSSETSLILNQKEKKQGFLSKFFSMFGKKKIDSNDSNVEQDKSKKVSKKPKNMFKEYKKTIELFHLYYTHFLVVDLDGTEVVDKQTANMIMANIHNMLKDEKRGYELSVDNQMYLMAFQPHELWKEISKYYSRTLDIALIIQNFENNLDKFEVMYKENPELFDTKRLEEIFAENDQRVVDLKTKNKEAELKSAEVLKKKQEEKGIRQQLKELEERRNVLRAKNQKIKGATTLSELGYKSKDDAASKLEIDIKDYIIIPIPSEVTDIEDVFSEEKRLRVEVDGKSYFTTFSNDVAIGRINSIGEKNNKTNSVLLVPISELKKEDIDSVRTGKIALNKSVLNRKNLMAIIPEGRMIRFGNSSVDIKKYTYGNLYRHLEEFLGEDYTENLDETGNYKIFKGISSVSSKEKRLKKDAVKKCIMENVRRDVSSMDTILVNGKTFFVNKEDEVDIRKSSLLNPLDENVLYGLADDIETYILEDGKNTAKVNDFYKKLLTEYMRVNQKAKADYYEEDNTEVEINGKKMSIKPTLPANDGKVCKVYTRPKEDIVYRVMKLAALVNRFAHLTENEKLKNTLYDVKLDLIEHAIDLSQNNPNVNMMRQFDKDKMVMSVILEIPGYNMIALHAKNKCNSLSYKANRLPETDIGVVQTSMILAPGVNKELLMEMKKMNEEERGKFLIGLDSEVFYKLAIRMGYTSETNSSVKDRKKFIKKMISDKKLDELLKDNDELEK